MMFLMKSSRFFVELVLLASLLHAWNKIMDLERNRQVNEPQEPVMEQVGFSGLMQSNVKPPPSSLGFENYPLHLLSSKQMEKDYEEMMQDKQWFQGLSDECRGWIQNWKGHNNFASQVGQDWWLFANMFRGKRNGFYLDVGAYNPKFMSNTYFFDKCLGWKGICVEANPDDAKNFVGTRSCILENVCISALSEQLWLEPIPGGSRAYTQTPSQADIDRLKLIKVPCMSMDELLKKHNVTHVDFMSLDVEFFEQRVLEAFHDWSMVDVIIMEAIWGTFKLQWLMSDHGFARITDVGGLDDVYIRFPKLLQGSEQAAHRGRTFSGFAEAQAKKGSCFNG